MDFKPMYPGFESWESHDFFYLFLCPRDNIQGALRFARDNIQGALRFAPVCPSVCLSVRPFVTLYGIEFV